MNYIGLRILRDILKWFGYLLLIGFFTALFYGISIHGTTRLVSFGLSLFALLSGFQLLVGAEFIGLFLDIAEDTYETQKSLKAIAKQTANIALLLQKLERDK